MRFNPDLSTQAKKMVFNHKDKNINHSPICFDNTLVNQASKQIYLGLILDKWLSLEDHIKKISKYFKFKRVQKNRFITQTPNAYAWSSLVTIYKTFIRPHFY